MAAQDIIPKKLVIPTGFEPAERAIELRQQIAQALMQEGMQPNEHMISPLEVLGKLAQQFVGQRGENRAMKEQAALDQEIRGAYTGILGGLNHDVNSGMPLRDIVEKYQGNPLAEEFIKPYVDAYAKGLSNREDIVKTNGTYGRVGDFIGKPVSNPEDVVKPTSVGPDGSFTEGVDPTAVAAKNAASPNAAYPIAISPQNATNVISPNGASVPSASPAAGGVATPSAPPAAPVPPTDPAVTRAKIARALGQVESGNRDLNPDGSPVRNPTSGALYRFQVLPSTARSPGFGVMPARDQSPAEYDRVGMDYFAAMMNRYHDNLPEALGAYNAGPGTMDHALSAGGPLPGQDYARKVIGAMGSSRPPDGATTDGHPYWIVNGQAYDNPEGR